MYLESLLYTRGQMEFCLLAGFTSPTVYYDLISLSLFVSQKGRDYERVMGIESTNSSLACPLMHERWKGIEPSTFSLGRRHSTFELPSQKRFQAGKEALYHSTTPAYITADEF